MACTAKLFLGPRDGEEVGIVEPTATISIMAAPSRNTPIKDKPPSSSDEYDMLVYRRDRHEGPGVFRYIYERTEA